MMTIVSNPTLKNPSARETLQQTGHVEAEAGLYFYNARFYDP